MHNLSLLQSVFDISTSLLLINGTEDEIHLLEGAALGLFEEYNHKDAHGETEDAEHEESSPANLVDGARSHLGNDEVEQPLGGCTEADTIGTETSWEDLETMLVECNLKYQ
jgi:hypothetical protein